MNKKMGIFGMGIAAVLIAVAFTTLLPDKQQTYNYENGSFPPPDPISAYSTQFVSSIEEAEGIVGYQIDEPKFPSGYRTQLIGVYKDRIVQIYASPNSFDKETLDVDFLWKLQGVVVHYEKPPADINVEDLPTHVEKWAEQENVSVTTTESGGKQAFVPIHKAEGPEGTFDQPAKLITEKDGIKIIVRGFLSANDIQNIVSDS